MERNLTGEILSVLFPVFSVISGGYLFARWKKTKDLTFVTEFITYVAAPLLVFYSLTDRELPFESFYRILASSLFVGIAGLILSAVVSRRIADGEPAATLTMAFMNSGNMGLPVCYFAFGRKGLAAATIFFVTMSIIHYTAGTAVASGRGKVRDAFLLPLAPAALAGIVMNRLNVNLPDIIERPVKLLADSAIPLMLFALGVRLFGVKSREKVLPWIIAGMRFMIGLSTGAAAVFIFRLKGMPAWVVLLQSCMPPAVFNFILCEKFNRKPELSASAILAGTLLALLTLPLLLYSIFLYSKVP
jgi:hypothetical protein